MADSVWADPRRLEEAAVVFRRALARRSERLAREAEQASSQKAAS